MTVNRESGSSMIAGLRRRLGERFTLPPRLSAIAVRLIGIVRDHDLPVLAQEMRVRQRGSRPYISMFVYVILLAIITVVVIAMSDASNPYHGSRQMSDVGRGLFSILSYVQLGLIVLLVPASTAGAISMEREKGTFQLLALSLLSTSAIVIQKMLVAGMEMLMLVLASAPVIAIVFLLGGVSPGEVALVYLILVVSAVLFGSFGVLCSCFLPNTRASMFAAYLVPLIFLIGLPMASAWLASISQMGMYNAMETSPVTFTLMFAFVGGLFALIAYGILALVLKRKTRLWQTRAFRIGVFGGAYAFLLLIMSTPSLLDQFLFLGGSGHEFPLPFYVNPFFVLFCITNMDSSTHVPSGYSGSLSTIAVTATLAFSIACTYFFQRISVFKVNALRCS